MNDYSDFPPLLCFKRILLSTPQSAYLYVSLWKLKQESDRISIKRTAIKKNFLISPTLFRNYLLALGRLELLTFEETTYFFNIAFPRRNED